MNPADFFEIWWYAPLLFAIGVFAGINNVLAGGGSLVTIPMLIFFGLDASVANGTNRLAIAIQNVFAVSGFRHKGVGNIKFSLLLILPALPGVILGTVVASTVSDILFQRILSGVMILVLILILSKRSSKSATIDVDEESLTWRQKSTAMVLFAGIGFYSGFIQAGVGFLVIASLALTTGLNLVKINSHKVFVIGICTWIAVIIFAFYQKIIWSIALILSAGNALGGWLGSLAAVAGGEKWIKRVLTVAIIAMALKLSGLIQYIFNLN